MSKAKQCGLWKEHGSGIVLTSRVPGQPSFLVSILTPMPLGRGKWAQEAWGVPTSYLVMILIKQGMDELRKNEIRGLERWSGARSSRARVRIPAPMSGDSETSVTPAPGNPTAWLSYPEFSLQMRKSQILDKLRPYVPAGSVSRGVPTPTPIDPVRMKVISWLVGAAAAGPAAVSWALWGAKADGLPRSEDLPQPGWPQPRGAG